MEKVFAPSAYEAKWQRFWRERGFYRAEAPAERPSFCIMIPPPNVTGRLHMGHALQSALQDLLTRWKRMQGFNALWLPGTDHAGIATQLMVERQLREEGTSRQELGRERFLARMWEWKEHYHDNIRQQLEMLGASCDWSRERFTLDEGLSRAVRVAFVQLYREGLIQRGEYMVNWSPALETAVSDLEVEMRTVKGKLYHVAYALKERGEGDPEGLVVATTRPETMLGDVALAVHPEDERYRHLVGRTVVLPILGRELPVIGDEAVDPAFGTGVLKITPFHDPHDFLIGQRHGLPSIQVIDKQAKMTAAAGDDLAGLDRFEARAKVVERLQADSALVKVEDHEHNVGHSQRGGEPIEPLLSTQWFCNVEGMAKQALEAVRDGRLRLVPESWVKTWEHWLENIKPWCISRQLWWGHQVPAWYTADGRTIVAHDVNEAARLAGTDELTQDPDVLDTWFSSGLWPFSTLGWPEDTVDRRTFYPTDVLITGFDILFFWVARMAMFGLHFTGTEPFSVVHLTGLVRDAEGQKMSKTKGNILDPEELVHEYGADALRFTLAALDSPGRDIPVDRGRMAGYRAFGNKIWNATRFSLSKTGEARVQPEIVVDGLAAPERWILSRLSRTAGEVNRHLESFRFDEACSRLYHFFWGELCDWYIELSKPALGGDAPRPQAAEVLLTVLERSLRLLHPVMPHLSEELWHRLPGHEAVHPETISLAPYPTAVLAWEDPALEERMETLMALITRVRAMRAELQIAPKAAVTLHFAAPPEGEALLREYEPLLRFLLRPQEIVYGAPPEGVPQDLVASVRLGIQAQAAALDDKERQRLQGELAKLDGAIQAAETRLGDDGFLGKAPAQVVEQQRARLGEMRARREQLRQGLES
ncbi:MAG TPA: valine--tRNA ligase [Thermoanaerobaculia bacterium]|jgi:valyl-tRNA synthetase|nr:valine--tRNA ligase [Thermoanaerobaculia bacterium]